MCVLSFAVFLSLALREQRQRLHNGPRYSERELLPPHLAECSGELRLCVSSSSPVVRSFIFASAVRGLLGARARARNCERSVEKGTARERERSHAAKSRRKRKKAGDAAAPRARVCAYIRMYVCACIYRLQRRRRRRHFHRVLN